MGGWRVELTRSGGFAGVRRSVAVDADELDPAEAEAYEALLDRVQDIEQAGSQTRGADRFQYDLTITREEGSRHLTLRDGDVPAAARPLLDRLLDRLRAG